MTQLLPIKGKFHPRNVSSNLSTSNGFNPNNVQQHMGRQGAANCNHQWVEKTLKVVRDGRGTASKNVEMRCLLCGIVRRKNVNYVDNRVYRG
jgi:hypothetical protein